jgi:iron-sulfur cluster repair protein YtfE (RIC family)
LQEGIDVAVILNALRALGGGGRRQATLPKVTSERMRLEHQELQGLLDRIRALAERLEGHGSDSARSELRALDRLLQERLLPHQRREEADVYPLVARLLGGRDPMAALSRTHREILHLVNVYGRLIADLPAPGIDPAVWSDLRRVLFSLEAILRLHIDQEDEIYDIVAQAG